MIVLLSYAVGLMVPLGALAVGTWTIRRHDRIYPAGRPLDGGRCRRRFDASGWLWRNS